jgi:tRNA modification GTPase
VGRPNAGKSSLLNQLLGHDRAIVSAIPGTTRDTVEETANIRGLPVVFIDTAGLRDAGDDIEAEGIRRSHEALTRAEMILHVLDASEPFSAADAKYLTEFVNKKRILVINKVDLPRRLELPQDAISSKDYIASLRPGANQEGGAPLAGSETGAPHPWVVDVSCATGLGMEELKNSIKNLVWSGEIKAEMLQVMINSRHQDALRRALVATQRTLDALRADLTLELAAMDLRIAVNAVGEIVGKTTTEDLLDSIFSQFCIGK